MRVLLYTKEDNRVGDRLEMLMGLHIPEGKLVVCHTVGSLREKLQRLNHEAYIGVLVADSPEELAQIGSIKSFPNRFKIILILPDREEATLEAACRLNPCLMHFGDKNLGRLVGALGNMVMGIS